jgi:hypothetical protein
MELEAARVALVDRDAEDVGRQHVAGELDALELQPERSREHVRERRLADAGRSSISRWPRPSRQARARRTCVSLPRMTVLAA